MEHMPETWGRPRNDVYPSFSELSLFPQHTNPTHHSHAAPSGPTTHTQQPIVTGTSVIGLKFKDGVMIATDKLASYGSLARFKDVERVLKVGEYTAVGAGGDVSDYQYIQTVLDNLLIHEEEQEDGHHLTPTHIHTYLSRLMYARRTKMNPLWNALLVGGYNTSTTAISHSPTLLRNPSSPDTHDPRFLAYVDLLGTTYAAPSLATGFGAHLAIPLLRNAVDGKEDTLTEEEARKVVAECMKVLYYRDARSIDVYDLAVCTESGVKVEREIRVESEWKVLAGEVKGYGAKPTV